MFTNTKPTSFDYDFSGQLHKHVGSKMYISWEIFPTCIEVNWKVGDQINPIQNTISKEIRK